MGKLWAGEMRVRLVESVRCAAVGLYIIKMRRRCLHRLGRGGNERRQRVVEMGFRRPVLWWGCGGFGGIMPSLKNNQKRGLVLPFGCPCFRFDIILPALLPNRF